MRRKSTVLIALLAAASLAGCASTGKTSSAPKSSFAAATVTHTVTSPAAASVSTTSSAPKPKPKPKAKPQTFTGSADENIGSIKVSGPSTLTWQCTSCGSGNFIIGNNYGDANQLDVNALDQTSGSTYVDAGTYTDVSITTEGQGWTFTINPGNSTQRSTSNVSVQPPATTQTAAPDTATTAPETTAPAASSTPVGNNPLATVNNYWEAINSGDYAGAWSEVAPDARASSPSVFARSEEQDGVQGASFDGELSSMDGESATVSVDSLVTHDYAGCQSWSGTYQLSDETGSWVITQAGITPHACD